VSVCDGAPIVRDVGDKSVTVGTGLPAETVKFTGLDEPPPGAGFVTTSGKLPEVERSVEVSEIVI
jgi:hypothetical protein